MNEAIPPNLTASYPTETFGTVLGNLNPSQPQNIHLLRNLALKDIPTVTRNGQYYQFHCSGKNEHPVEAPQDPCWRGYLSATISPTLLQYERRLAWRAGYQMGYKEAVDFATAYELWIPNRWYLPSFMSLNSLMVPEEDSVEPWPLKVSRSVWLPSSSEALNKANVSDGEQTMETDEQQDPADPNSKKRIEAAVAWAKQLQKALILNDNELRNRARLEMFSTPKAVNSTRRLVSHAQVNGDPTDKRLSTITEELEDRISAIKRILPAIPELPVTPFADFNDDSRFEKKHSETSSELSATEASPGSPTLVSQVPAPNYMKGGFASPSLLPEDVMLPSELLNGDSTPSTDEHGREIDSSKRIMFLAGRPCFTTFLTEKPRAPASDVTESKRRQSSADSTNSRSRNGPRKFHSEWRADLSSWRKS